MLLSLHTCGTTGSVALGRFNEERTEVEILAQAALPSRAYAAQLNPRVSEMLSGQHATIRDIEAIVVVRGPGSFTGIRIGLSAAKGWAQPAGIPLISLSRLELIAGVSGLPHVLATVDAGRGDYYVGEYREGRKIAESLLSQEETLAVLRQPGAGVLVYEQVLEDKTGADSRKTGDFSSERATGDGATPESPLAPYHPMYVQAPDAVDALRLALNRFRSGSFEDVETLDANYLRRPDAEIFIRPAHAENGHPHVSGVLPRKTLSAT
jgi:tRNA threonylcarbamoyladenosine biosynthesis protein TsaB